jgi:hypothetical protein
MKSDEEVLVLVTLWLSYSELRLTKASGALTGYESSQLESSLTRCLQRQIPSYVRVDSTQSVTEVRSYSTQNELFDHSVTLVSQTQLYFNRLDYVSWRVA